MSEHQHHTVERHCDVAIVGASVAALIAAQRFAEDGRGVIVVDDDGHGVGAAPADLEEVRRHGVEVLAGRVVATHAHAGATRVELTGGHTIVARRVLAAAAAEREATAIAADLAAEDASAGVRSANEADWDRRYSGEQIWSGNPNGALVVEITGLAPGRALDVGAGEGGDAVWLAMQGWEVTANDVSRRALDRVSAEAVRRGIRIDCLHADANTPGAFGSGRFDLVSAHYASIPRRVGDPAVRNLVDAVAPGGTLLVVSHDLAPMRTPIDISVQSRAFDPDAYVRVDDVAAAIASDPSWEVVVSERRPRPAGAASGHHVDDVILRARRLA